MALAGELATNVAASFVYDVLKRPFAALKGEIERRDQIGRALNGRPTVKTIKNSALLDKVVEDMARVIGNREGKLTEPVAEFLRELQRTAIPDAIASSALCGSSKEDAFPPFNSFYLRFSNIPFSSKQLFEAIYEASLARVECVQDKAMLEIVRAQHSVLNAKVGCILSSLNILQAKNKVIDVDTLRDCRTRAAKLIEAANRYITVETLQGSKKYGLRSLAIQGRLMSLSTTDIQSAKFPNVSVTETYIAFRRRFDRAVMLGDPGGGKSTLTQLLSFDLANMITLEANNPGRKDFEPRDLKLPLRIVLRSFEARNNRDPSYSFLDYIRDEIKVGIDNNSQLTQDFIEAILSTGEALIIFDGLDEILRIGARRNIVTFIEQFAEVYAACQVLVTSRLVGYRDATLNDSFSVTGLDSFDGDEISKYSERAIKAVKNIKLKQAKSEAEDFVAQTDKVGDDIRKNPLMLQLMVQIFAFRGDVPSNRPEVYKECATLMFEKWDGRRDIVADVPRHDMELLDVFGYVASKTFGDAAKEEGVSREWLLETLKANFRGWYLDKASVTRAATSLVDFLTGRAWVMSEVGPGIFKFTHRTFLEYFFARHLISESRSIDDLIQVSLLPKAINNEWSVISQLALHMAVFRDGGKTRQAGESIIATIKTEVYPAKEEFAFLDFVATALSYLLLPEATFVEIVSIVAKRAITLGAHENLNAISIFWTLFKATGHRWGLIRQAITKSIDSVMAPGRPSREYMFCVYLFGARRPQAIIVPKARDFGVYDDTVFDNLKKNRDGAQKKTLILADDDAATARAYIYCYGDNRVRLYKKHGERLLRSHASPLEPIGLDQVLSAALEELTFNAYNRDARSSFSLNRGNDLFDFVWLVADDIVSERLDLGPLQIPDALRADVVENDIQFAFRNIYSMPLRQRRLKPVKELLARCLVCILAISDQFEMFARPPRTSKTTRRLSPLRPHRSAYRLAPTRVMVDVAGSLEGSEPHEWIKRRLADRGARDEPVAEPQ